MNTNTNTNTNRNENAENAMSVDISTINRVQIVNSKRDGARKIVLLRSVSRWVLPSYVKGFDVDSVTGRLWKSHEGEKDENTALVALGFYADACGLSLGDAMREKIASAENEIEHKKEEKRARDIDIIKKGEKSLRDDASERAGKRYASLVKKYHETARA